MSSAAGSAEMEQIMIQDILPQHMCNAFERRKPLETDKLMCFSADGIFLKCEEMIAYPLYGVLRQWCAQKKEREPQMIFLFSIGGTAYFLAELPEDFGTFLRQQGYEFVRMFDVRRLAPKEEIFAAATAWHLYVWYRDNRFCGRCGHRMLHGESERLMRCADCGNVVFPKIAPAVIVGVTDGDKLLMTKYAGREYKRYALIAGFTEIGETAEETVQREVMEEVGIKVKNIRYYKSQPWGFDMNLLMGFFCEPDGGREIHLDEQELAVAEWVDARDVPDDAEGLSLTQEMMRVFKTSFS